MIRLLFVMIDIMEMTQPVDWLNKKCIGYVVNTEFTDENKKTLVSLMDDIRAEFGEAVFCMPEKSLHITLLDWIAPLVDYGGQNKDGLFDSIRPEFDKTLSEIISGIRPITVRFDQIRVSPSTIIITGSDNGEFRDIRDNFINSVELLPGTKLPPEIIHSSLARFTKAIDLNAVNSYIASKDIYITQQVTGFRLVRTTKEPLMEFEELKRYYLG